MQSNVTYELLAAVSVLLLEAQIAYSHVAFVGGSASESSPFRNDLLPGFAVRLPLHKHSVSCESLLRGVWDLVIRVVVAGLKHGVDTAEELRAGFGGLLVGDFEICSAPVVKFSSRAREIQAPVLT